MGNNYYNSPFKFNGKELDEATGFYYYGARYYDPRVSVWMSVDPLAEKFPNFNPYNYVMQNPLNLVDPSGLEPEEGRIDKKDKDIIQKSKDYIFEKIDKKNQKIDKIKDKISHLENKQSQNFTNHRQKRIERKKQNVNEIRLHINVLNRAVEKINFILDENNHGYNISIGNNIGREMGDGIQEAGNVSWGNTANDLIVNTNKNKDTLIHELSHLYDIITNNNNPGSFISNSIVTFNSLNSEIDAYRITYALGSNLPANVTGGIRGVNSEWFRRNLLKNYRR